MLNDGGGIAFGRGEDSNSIRLENDHHCPGRQLFYSLALDLKDHHSSELENQVLNCQNMTLNFFAPEGLGGFSVRGLMATTAEWNFYQVSWHYKSSPISEKQCMKVKSTKSHSTDCSVS
ncbi:hypothetical protein N7513_001808 [Penicillium frequentans]|nr:hypothetical protein N7513_001808 [Penicillium glabrum]